MAAHRSGTPASLEQEQHLRSYLRSQEQGLPLSRLVCVTWVEPGQCDVVAMTAAINGHLNRHDTYRSRFLVTDRTCERYELPEGHLIDFRPADRGVMSGPEIRAAIEDVPGSVEWDCFRFFVIQHQDSFTVCAAIDHLHCDGLLVAPVFGDIHNAYLGHKSPSPATSHLDFCGDQAARVSRLTMDSPEVQEWRTFVADSEGTSTLVPPRYRRSAMTSVLTVHSLMDGAASRDFERECGRNGVRLIGGLLGVVGCAWNRASGASRFRCVSPTILRDIPDVTQSLGWETGVVPVSFATDGRTPVTAMRCAQSSFDDSRHAAWIPPAAVMRVLGQDTDNRAGDWSIPVVSLMDYTRSPFDTIALAEWTAREGRLLLNDGVADQVLLWFVRDEEGVTLTVSAPHDRVGEDWVSTLVSQIRALCHGSWSEDAA